MKSGLLNIKHNSTSKRFLKQGLLLTEDNDLFIHMMRFIVLQQKFGRVWNIKNTSYVKYISANRHAFKDKSFIQKKSPLETGNNLDELF